MQENITRLHSKSDNKVYSLINSSKSRNKSLQGAKTIKLALLDERAFALASFSDYLHRADDQFFVCPFSDATAFLDKYTKQIKDIDMLLLNVGTQSVKSRNIEFTLSILQQQMPELPIIIVADTEDANSILEAIRVGAKGYITTSLPPSVVIAAINLVHAGGVFIPAFALCDALMEHEHSKEELSLKNPVNPICLSQLTPRQLEVLDHLRRGEPNKVIAYDLGMKECTVKVHVRDIMKKLKATNRTHLAFLASRFLPKNEPVG